MALLCKDKVLSHGKFFFLLIFKSSNVTAVVQVTSKSWYKKRVYENYPQKGAFPERNLWYRFVIAHLTLLLDLL